MKIALACLGVTSPFLALVLGAAAISGGAPAAAADTLSTSVCLTSGALPGLTRIAADNARIVSGVSEELAGPRAAVIAVMAGYTESGLRILGNPTVNTGGHNTQGSGSNYDSIGIFQQRASWGTVAQRLDPELSTELFVDRLTKIPNWATAQPWVAAQDVQRSAWDGVPRAANDYSRTYGGNYEVNYARARSLVSDIDADPANTDCGALTGGLPASTAPGSHGLPTSYRIPQSASAAESRVVAFAIAQLDKPYVFGAAGPDSYDCSGLVMAAWKRAGVQLPHSSQAQAQEGAATVVSALVPGDLVLVPGEDGTLAAPGHVGLYIGDGLVLNAADEHDGIRVQTYANFLQVGHGLAALRHIA